MFTDTGMGRLPRSIHERRFPAHLVPHIQVEAGDEPVALEHGDERPRHDDAALGMLPAHERLEAHDAPRAGACAGAASTARTRGSSAPASPPAAASPRSPASRTWNPRTRPRAWRRCLDRGHGQHGIVAGGADRPSRLLNGAYADGGAEPDGVLGVEGRQLELAVDGVLGYHAAGQHEGEVERLPSNRPRRHGARQGCRGGPRWSAASRRPPRAQCPTG